MLKRFLLLALFSTPVMAVPILSGGLSGNGGTFVPIGGSGGTELLGRIPFQNPGNNVAAIATAAGVTSSDLTGLLPGGVRAAIITGTFTGGIVGDGIRFIASNLNINLSPANPAYAYYAALDDLTGANPTLFMPLNLTTTPQTFEFLLPAAGNYQFSIGAIRTNPNPGVLGTYTTTVILANVTGFGTPELDPARSTLPLLFCSALLLSLGKRRALA